MKWHSVSIHRKPAQLKSQQTDHREVVGSYSSLHTPSPQAQCRHLQSVIRKIRLSLQAFKGHKLIRSFQKWSSCIYHTSAPPMQGRCGGSMLDWCLGKTQWTPLPSPNMRLNNTASLTFLRAMTPLQTRTPPENSACIVVKKSVYQTRW